jgi:hypothetical protein
MVFSGVGLAVGPAVTSDESINDKCLDSLRKEFKTDKEPITAGSYLEAAERIAAASNENETHVREFVAAFFRSCQPSYLLHSLVKGRWDAVVSLSADTHFAKALQEHYDKTPLPRAVTRIAGPNIVPTVKSLPVYQLLGDPDGIEDETRLAVLASDYLTRRRSWSRMLRVFPDYLKGDPLFFAGTASVVDLVCDFVNELMAAREGAPHRLIFLADDPTASNAKLCSLVKNRCVIRRIRCTLSEFCDAVSPSSLAVTVQPQPTPSDAPFDDTRLLAVEDQIGFVAHGLPQVPVPQNKHRLLDLLFSPNTLDWSPYSADLDFRRDVLHELTETVIGRLQQPGPVTKRCLVVKGEAGVGKTVVLRRLAFDLTKRGFLCIWIKRGYGLVAGSRFEMVVSAIKDAVRGKRTSVVLFYDDPIGGRTLPREVLSALAKARFPWAIVFGVRNSELVYSDDPEHEFYLTEADSIEVQKDFTTAETERLPAYLVSLEAAKDQNDARILLNSLGSRQTALFPDSNLFRESKDVLCTLWYLLPQTKGMLRESLTSEYLRLGGVAGVVERFAEDTHKKNALARTAYELVTTTSGLGLALPVEVLVSSLKVLYEDWRCMCSEKTPLWGLLYDEPYPEAQTFGYRTRNHIVTKILLGILNGGASGHAGEFRCLRQLVAACDASGVQYREFLCDVLVRRKRFLKERLTFEQGLELYDLAITTFPIEDRTLAHHRALWIKDVGNDPLRAYRELECVHRIAMYPQATRQELKEHIHTSMAACALQAVTQNVLDPMAGFDMVHQNIAQASVPYHFDLHSQHVHAKTLINMATYLRDSDVPKSIECLEEASNIIERALIIIDPMLEERVDLSTAQRMFHDLSTDIAIAFQETDELQKIGYKLLEEHGNQTGLVLAARAMLAAAKGSDKGRPLKRCQDFINEAVRAVEKRCGKVSPSLRLCRAQLLIIWRVQSKKGDVPWECIRDDLKAAVDSPLAARDPIWMFFLAVAHFHLGETSLAEAVFSSLRQMKMSSTLRNPDRCFFMGPTGSPKTFQGILKSGATDHRYVECQELGIDLRTRRFEFRQPDGATVHFHIVFSMLGASAVSYSVSELSSIGE